jgi:hypothetical protein
LIILLPINLVTAHLIEKYRGTFINETYLAAERSNYIECFCLVRAQIAPGKHELRILMDAHLGVILDRKHVHIVIIILLYG